MTQLMQQQMGTQEMVVATMTRIDARIIATDFLQDWQFAMHAANRATATRDRIRVMSGQLVRKIFTPIGATGVLLMLFSIGVSTILLNKTEIQQQGITEPAGSLASTVTLDPNRPWYGPTDDLLRVAVLQYERQWPTYAIYDPLTLEIK